MKDVSEIITRYWRSSNLKQNVWYEYSFFRTMTDRIISNNRGFSLYYSHKNGVTFKDIL